MTREKQIDWLCRLKSDISYVDFSIDVEVSLERKRQYRQVLSEVIKALEQEPIEKCTWIKYDYRTMCPKEHDIDNPYWRIPEKRMKTLKYCPYCGKEIEVEE